jgi:uncharacterized protein YkwD
MRFLFLLLILFPVVSFGQNQSKWTRTEIAEADVARNINGISDFEKDVILYHNLVRLYPNKYLQVEILNLNDDLQTKDKIKFPNNWRGTDINSHYYKTLISTLSRQQPLPKLSFDYGLSSTAKCLAKEQSVNGSTGHNRINCPKISSIISTRNMGYGTGENCGYGKYNGKDAVNNLLIDEDVPSLGHRDNILNPKFTKIGAGTAFHPRYETVIVVDYLYEVPY